MKNSHKPVASNSKLIRIVLVDDHAAVRAGYRLLLESSSSITVIDELSSGEEIYQKYEQLKPDVLIIDLSMPGMGGLEAINRLHTKHPDARILVFTMHDSPLLAERALNAGALGYVTKNIAPEKLIQAVKKIANGQRVLDPALQHISDSEKNVRKKNIFSQLSNREFQIFCLCAEGDSVTKIANRLSLSNKTVSNYLTQIKEKLQAETTTQLLRLALQHGIVDV